MECLQPACSSAQGTLDSQPISNYRAQAEISSASQQNMQCPQPRRSECRLFHRLVRLEQENPAAVAIERQICIVEVAKLNTGGNEHPNAQRLDQNGSAGARWTLAKVRGYTTTFPLDPDAVSLLGMQTLPVFITNLGGEPGKPEHCAASLARKMFAESKTTNMPFCGSADGHAPLRQIIPLQASGPAAPQPWVQSGLSLASFALKLTSVTIQAARIYPLDRP